MSLTICCLALAWPYTLHDKQHLYRYCSQCDQFVACLFQTQLQDRLVLSLELFPMMPSLLRPVSLIPPALNEEGP